MKKSSSTVAFITTLLNIALLTWSTDARGARFLGLGDLPGGESFSFAHGVSADGSVVVGASGSKLAEQSGSEGFPDAYRWTSSGGMVGLSGGFISNALGASADGSVVVGSVVFGGSPQAFRWTSGEGMVGMRDLLVRLYDFSFNHNVLVCKALMTLACKHSPNPSLAGLRREN